MCYNTQLPTIPPHNLQNKFSDGYTVSDPPATDSLESTTGKCVIIVFDN